VTYLTDAHRACAQRISHWMREIGFDEVEIDAVGNVVGRYKAATEGAKTLLTGSHYDTVRNGGKYDGRLGIFVPMACVKQLAQQGKRLPFNIEVVGFSEEEGQRYKATFLGSGALVGDFKQEWLEQKDADGITLREAMLHAGLCIDDIPKLERDPAKYLGFVEVHIEQGPCSTSWTFPWASSPPSTAAPAMSANSSAWPATPAPRPWTAAATPQPAWPSCRCTSKSAPARTATAWPPSAS
jgi:N-carbamoyl-L-amino-acid hydrolase